MWEAAGKGALIQEAGECEFVSPSELDRFCLRRHPSGSKEGTRRGEVEEQLKQRSSLYKVSGRCPVPI